MMSAFSRQLLRLRRPLPTLSCTQCNQTRLLSNQQRWASSSGGGGRKQTHAAKLRKEAKAKGKRVSVAGSNNMNTANNAKKKKFAAPPPPKVRKDIPKAPHMQADALSTNKEGWKEYLIRNPLLFGGVIFPTAVMGVLIAVKPKLREQFLHMIGVNSKDKNDVRNRNGSLLMPKETPVPVYDEVETITITTASASGGSNSKAIETTIDIANHNAKDAKNAGPKEEEGAKKGNKTVDLIHVIGIRPHQS